SWRTCQAREAEIFTNVTKPACGVLGYFVNRRSGWERGPLRDALPADIGAGIGLWWLTAAFRPAWLVASRILDCYVPVTGKNPSSLLTVMARWKFSKPQNVPAVSRFSDKSTRGPKKML